ncbi:MAG: SGNH/GDSL hydrolase family protein [Chloroflexi bacterium]|nr:SGNH/GDSL hydrolase family protein [Chloroflexota bacterium]
MIYWLVYSLILILGIALGGGLLLAIQRLSKGPAWVTKLLPNVIVSLMTVFLTFMAAEVIFKVFFAQSDGWNQTLASHNWFERYWVKNSLGYRDVEWSEEDLRNKKKILVVGDSFAAGQGIENVEDRFSNLLGHKLGSDYLVMNVAWPGLSTTEEIENLKGFRYKPEILIWQYFINDIRYTAHERNVKAPDPNIDPWPIFEPLVSNSYVVNFIYWRVMRLKPNIIGEMNNMDWLKRAYNDPGVWWTHQQELLSVYEGAASEQVKLIVVVFPDLVDVEGSQEITAKVVNLFKERGVPTLDVTELVKDVPTPQLIVNSVDPHPNEWVHRQVADKLYELITTMER